MSFCIDDSEYTPINIAVRRENFDIENDLKFAVSEDSDHFHQEAVGSQRSVANTVPALMNLESLSCTGKPQVRWHESIMESFSSTGEPVQVDESVAGVERNLSRTQVDRYHNSEDKPCLREHLETKADTAIQGEKEGRSRLSDAEAHLESRDWEKRKSEFVFF